jgi:hypothetical protein
VHDAAYICEVKIDEPGVRDEVGYALDSGEEDLVCDGKSLGDRNRRVSELKESVVGDDYQRVDLCPKAFNSRFGLFTATTRLEAKGRSDNTDGERTYRFRNSRDNGRTAGSGSATFACCDENEVRAGEAFFNFGCVVFRGATTDFGVGASTETTR